MLTHSEVGAVLFGGKPVCIDGARVWPFVPNYLLGERAVARAEYYRQGLKVWTQLGVKETNFSLVPTARLNRIAGAEFLFVNHRALIKTVDEHLELFRKRLGPYFQSHELLQALLMPGVDVMEVLCGDKVLLGIILGYGVQNSMLHTRYTRLMSLEASKEQLPQAASKRRCKEEGSVDPDIAHTIAWTLPTEEPGLRPVESGALERELALLGSRFGTSLSHPASEGYLIPQFGCDTESDETLDLIKRYRLAATKTSQLLQAEDFLEECFDCLCS